MKKEIAELRKDYQLETLNESDIAANPIDQFTSWWQQAIKSEIDEVNAMTLATATQNGLPSARIVLLKDYDERGFVFYTNYKSHKGNIIDENPNVALVFFWKELERQVRIEGIAEKVSNEESDAYFQSRPLESRIGAWASAQSSIINSRNVLEENVKKYKEEFGGFVPRPGHWGGYLVRPLMIEFWQGRSSRLHDRIQYTKITDGIWKTERLAP
jgi:pyridoxamine 5'-phosphate oxidase